MCLAGVSVPAGGRRLAFSARSVTGRRLQFVPANDNKFVMIVWIARKDDGWAGVPGRLMTADCTVTPRPVARPPPPPAPAGRSGAADLSRCTAAYRPTSDQ